MHNVNSYVKATLNPKVEDRNKALSEKEKQLSFKAGNVELEGDVSYTFAKDAKFGVNSKTTFPFKGEKNNYGASVVSTHKLYLDAKKLNSFKDIKAGLELQHSYDKDSSKAVKYVGLNAEGTYAGINKLDLTGKFNFRYQFNGTSKVSDLLTGDDITLASKDYMHSYELDAKYLMMDDKLELTGGAFVQHVYHNALALKSDALLKDVNVNEIVNNLASENVKTFLKNNADKVEAYKDALKKVKEEEAKLDKEEVIVEAKKDLKDAENDFNKKIDALRSVAFKNEKLKVTIAGILKDASSKGVAGLVEEILKEIKTKNQNGYAAKFKEIEPELKNDKNLTNSIKDLENAFNNIKAKREALETAYDEIEPEKLDSLTDAQEALYNAQIKLNPDVIDFLNNQEMVNQYKFS